MIRWAAVFAVALPMAALAQTVTDRYSSCVTGDGAWIDKVCYGEAFTVPQYGHDVLGGTPEWTGLAIFYGPAGQAAADGRRTANDVVLGPGYIFEDVAPRLADLDGDGRPEIITVETSFDHGARLAVYAVTPELRRVAATPHIGLRNRWLAPIGAADLDGDGNMEIAYIDRPHLAKTLTVWRYVDGELIRVTAASGLTNHRIGETDIAGGIRDCGRGPEMITANADWSRIMATRLVGGALQARDLGRHEGRNSFAAAMRCEPLPQ